MSIYFRNEYSCRPSIWTLPSPAGTEEKQEEPVNDIDEDVELRTTYSGIYLGQSMILHHFEEDLSIEYLDPMEIEDSQNNQTGFCYRNH